MTQTHSEAYLRQFTPEQLAYFFGFPLWVVLAWGIATWGSVVGSVLLLFRCGLALHAFVASFLGMLLTFAHNFILTDGMKVMGGEGKGPLVFTAAIILVGVLLLIYARALRQRGVLR